MACYTTKIGGAPAFICGNLGPHCSRCLGIGEFLCDFPVGKNKTCDASLCREHATTVAPDVHYCPGHAAEWQAFKESGGVKSALENVIPFPTSDV